MSIHKKIKTYKYLVALSYFLIYTQSVHAYLDPGTGSMLLAVIIGLLSTLVFTVRTMWHKIISVFSISAKKSRSDYKDSQYNNIVFYSEGKQYWNTFRSAIEILADKNTYATYLSSDKDDPGLLYESPYINCLYIGKGNKAYTYLNLLQARICVLTTPNLDTLQIRRSKGVEHYAHLLHSPTDIHLYKLFAFDFYDSFFISGPHQEQSLRHLEALRNTNEKQLFPVGCPYMDILLSKKQAAISTSDTNSHPTVLIAPTWGESGLLSIAGKELLQSILDKNYRVIVRPHPQSYIAESDMLDYLQKEFTASNVVWDSNPDNFESMQKAHLLISERSGIIFDFAFVFEKPILTYTTEAIVKEGMEGNDIPWDAWELDILPEIGRTFTLSDIPDISSLIDHTLDNTSDYISNIKSLRDSHLYNLGNTGTYVFEALNSIINSYS